MSLGIVLLFVLQSRFDRFLPPFKHFSDEIKYLTFAGLILIITGLIAFFYFPGSPEAEMQKLSNQEMRDVSGKALLEFDDFDGSHSTPNSQNSVCGSSGLTGNECLHFARIQMDVQGTVDATIGNPDNEINASIGNYDDAGDFGNSIYTAGCSGTSECRGSTPQADIEAEEFGLAGATLEKPYVELAFRDWSGDRELVGLRLGAERVDGTVTYRLRTLSGSISANHAFTGLARRAIFKGHRDQSASIKCCSSLLNYKTGPNVADGITFNNTEDFWVSVNKQDVLWQKNNPHVTSTSGNPNPGGSNQKFHTDGKGFWIHATDGVDACGIFGGSC